jgi:transmembrane sensor
MLHFDGETIAHAAKAFNRYNRTQILIDDPAIADRKVGGTFVRTDPESFVTALGLTMGIHATTVGTGDDRTIRLSGAETGK